MSGLTVTAPEGLPFVDWEREFDAPVPAVFRAHTDPERVRRWLGPRGYEMTISEWEATDGGRWGYVHNDGQSDYAFRGTFHTVRENDVIVQTFEFLGVPDVVSIESVRFVDVDGRRTRVVGHAVYPSLEARDGMVGSGMERGMTEGYERLDDLLAAPPAG